MLNRKVIRNLVVKNTDNSDFTPKSSKPTCKQTGILSDQQLSHFKENLSSTRVGIIASNSTGYIEAMFNCIECGKVAIPIKNADDQYRINAASISSIITPTDHCSWMRRQFIPSQTNEIALISFTSGTEGNPKGVMLTHNNLENVVTRLNSIMQLNDDIREYIGVPIYHSFGFGRCRAVATAGGKFFIPSNGFNPCEIKEMLRKGEINAISAVPSLWRVLLANKDVIGNYSKRVRWIEIGSQYMSRQEKEAMKSLFPEARIVQHYGLTEASRTTFLEIHSVEGNLLDSVGQASEGVEVKQTLEDRIAIRGEHVAAKYLINGKETSLQDDDGWLLTNDLGILENGYLYYQGRVDDVINCGGIKIYPEALETKIYASIGRSGGLAVCRKKDSIRGDGFLVAITKGTKVDQQKIYETVLRSTQELGVNAANAIAIIDVDSLPTTSTGKIQRKQLSEWYEKEYSQNLTCDDLSPTNNCSAIANIFHQTLKISSLQLQDTFVSLGGDSLAYIQVSMQLEKYLGKIPQAWESMTLEELEKLISPDTSNKISCIDADLDTDSTLTPTNTSCLLHIDDLHDLMFRNANIAGMKMGTNSMLTKLSEPQLQSKHKVIWVGLANLARQFADLCETYVFPPAGYRVVKHPSDYIYRVATTYVNDLLSTNIPEPYILVGWCFDALIAFEIAQQLRNKGKRVAQVILIEREFPNHSWIVRVRKFEHKLLTINYHIKQLQERDFLAQKQYVLDRLRKRLTKFKHFNQVASNISIENNFRQIDQHHILSRKQHLKDLIKRNLVAQKQSVLERLSKKLDKPNPFVPNQLLSTSEINNAVKDPYIHQNEPSLDNFRENQEQLIWKSISEVKNGYIPQVYAGNVTLLFCDHSTAPIPLSSDISWLFPNYGWRDMIAGKLQTFILPGHHNMFWQQDFLNELHIDVWIEKIKWCIENG